MIRKLILTDAQQYKTLRHQALQTDPDAYLAVYEEEKTRSDRFYQLQLDNPDTWTGYYGFFIENRLCGYLNMSQAWSVKMHHFATLHDLYVDPSARNKGIAKALIHSAEETAREAELTHLYISCTGVNLSAKNLYEKMGFILYARKPQAIKLTTGFTDVLFFWKPLSSF